MDIFTNFAAFVFGLIFGSFLNVCIHRMPQEQSIVSPGSHCPHCKTPIAITDNIPLLSFIFLGGKCRHCRKAISFRYFLVELASAMLWLSVWMMFGLSIPFFATVFLFSVLIVISVSDLETGLIPDQLTLPGIVIGLLFAFFYPPMLGAPHWKGALIQSAFGILAGGGSLLLVGLLGNVLFRKETMGGGDIKLMAMLGAFLGVKKVFLVLFFGPFVALPYALYAKIGKKAETIPFGPFLAIAGAWIFLYGDTIAKHFSLFNW
ncbi:MAG: prepilin peptidase [Candidatus Omnitrophica bacterium]|nr:prepilin peptidase [Candidatus Omnitrophota bacterium]